jgi:micrococcal nuclease
LLVAILLVLIFPVIQAVRCAEIDMTSYVSSVHDGDTFTLNTGDKVRLADLNAPELGQTGSYEARDYLDSLVYHQTVYLDVDDLYRTDSFGRLVCVVYVDYNSTHYLNVNKALIDGGYAEARNYDNEFNFNSFVLYLPKAGATEPGSDSISTFIPIAVIALVALVILLLVIGKIRR